jgi:hypothetical protein
MVDVGTRLSIDYWHTTVAAAAGTPDGGVVAVAVDGAAVWPTGVAVDEDGRLRAGRDGMDIGTRHPQSYVRMPGQRLYDEHITVAGVQVDPVDLVAATLSRAAREARTVTGSVTPHALVISIPAGWVERQRKQMLAAAKRAGMSQPTLVSGAESIVREQIARNIVVRDGSVVVVCRLDATVGELVVLRHQADTFKQIAMRDLGELGETPGATLTEQAATALKEALGAADTEGDQVAAVFCQVPPGVMPELSHALTMSADLRVAPAQVADLAATFGGARSQTSDSEPVTAGQPRARLHSTVGMLVAWFGAAVLAYQAVSSGTVYEATSVNGRMLVTEWPAWGLAPLFATLGALSAALLLSDLRAKRLGPEGDQAGPDPALGAALAVVAALGVGGAGVLALAGAAYFEIEPGPLLTWTLWSTVPLAVVLAVLGLVVARVSGRVPWRDRLRFPVVALVVASLSTACVIASYAGVPYVNPHAWWTMAHIGAFGIGWSAALLLVDDWWLRITLGFVLGTPAAIVIDIKTAGIISTCFVAAVTLWWLMRLKPAAPLASAPPVDARGAQGL